MSDKTLSISALARLSLTNPTQIRNYEQLGLLPPPTRPGQHAVSDTGGARRYGASDVSRLLFLRRCRDLGILNPRLKLLMELVDTPGVASEEAKDLATMVLGNVQDQVNELTELAKALEALLTGAGEQALTLTELDMAPLDGVKRMRRQVRKPLSTRTVA